ncbi:hypothetical protein EVAR_85510_1 [Eumeta japonica]|uniref:Uncharacterized protein n=1 Tax=Eumeta variegata TaxID=151549 RepID=A0A4C1VDA2_EUMVA|nr:hypothetical protein EVAR_85510_1 [Eumeta japonica]
MVHDRVTLPRDLPEGRLGSDVGRAAVSNWQKPSRTGKLLCLLIRLSLSPAGMRSGSDGRRRMRLEASQGFLCPHCIRSLNNLNAVLKRKHQEKVPSTKHGPRYRHGSGIRRRLKSAVLNLDSPSKCIILENVDDHVMRQPIGNVTKMATLFVNKMALPLRGRERNAQASNVKLDDSKAKLPDRSEDLADRNKNLDDSNANLDDWNRSDDSQEPSLSTHRSFPSLSDEPMVRDVPVKNNESKDRSRKRLGELGGAGAGSPQDGGGCKKCRRDSPKKEETDEQNQN